MKIVRNVMLGAVIALASMSGVAFAKAGTAAEAMALIAKAEAHFQKVGKKQALADFSNPAGEFVDGDLYLFCVGMDTYVVTAHGANQKLIGKDLGKIKDADGKFFIREMSEVAKTKGSGWVDYKWTHPQTRKIARKSSYVKSIGDQTCGVGIYK